MTQSIRLVSIALLLSGSLWGQFGSGLQGTITDRSSAVVPGVVVRVTRVDTGVSREVVSAEDGIYRIPSLAPGVYRVTALKAGFVTVVQDSVTLGVDEIRKVDFSLSIGNVQEAVTVTAAPTLLETEEGRVSGTVGSAQLRELPVPYRNVYNLLALQPGITGRDFSGDIAGGRTGSAIYASGQRKDANSYGIDNMSVNSVSAGGNAEITPNSESVEEVRIVSNNFSAAEGRSPGAHVSVISKSGTNEYHGSVWDYFQNNTLSGRNFFSTSSVAVFRRNQFGASGGGPIIHNRTFFFATYEGLRQSGAQVATATVETPQFRNFVVQTRPDSIAAKLLTQFKPVADPTTSFKDLGTPLSGVPACGGCANANLWNSAPSGFPTVGTAIYDAPTLTTSNQMTLRVDHELRPSKDRLYGYFYRAKGYSWISPVRPEFLRWTTTTGTFFNLNETHTFSPTLLNEFGLGLTRYIGVYTTPQHLEVPLINITGVSGFQNVNNSPGYGTPYYPGGWFPTEYMVKDTFSWIHGSHAIKFGGEIHREDNNIKHTSALIPNITFASILTFANDDALSMARTVDPRTGNPTLTDEAQRLTEGGAFIQDDWKARRNLTINVGLRYEYYGAYTDANNRLRNFLPGDGSNLFQQIGNGTAQVVSSSWPANHLDFGPRFGFAWDIGGAGKNVIRGGYGLGYDRLPTVTPAAYRNDPPLAGIVTLGTLYGTPFTYSLGDPSQPYLGYPGNPALAAGLDAHNGIKGVRVAMYGVDQQFHQPYTHNWFLGVQHALPGQVVVEVSFIGSAGHHLINIADINRFTGDLLNGNVFHGLNSSFSQIYMAETTSNSVYFGGTFSARRQFSKGFTFQSAYTYGKAITDADGSQTINYYDVNNRNLDRSVAGYDIRQRVSVNGVWDLPFLRTCRSWMCKTVGGWQLSGYTVIESGLPIDVISTAAYPRGDFNADGTNYDRPNAPAASVQRSGFSFNQYLTGIFTSSDFPLPASGHLGTLGRNSFRGPRFARTDLSLAKTFRATERLNAKLRLDAFNAFNRVNLNLPTGDLSSNNFGKSTAADIPRQLQVGLQLRF
jgi:hypothetical protein